MKNYVFYDCKILKLFTCDSLKEASELLNVSTSNLSRKRSSKEILLEDKLIAKRFKVFDHNPSLKERREALDLYYKKNYNTSSEVWKSIYGKENCYVSSLGRVKVKYKKNETMAMPYYKYKGGKGKQMILVKITGTEFSVAVLVKNAFIDNSKDLIVNHSNGDMLDNRAENIRGITKSEHGIITGGMSKSRAVIILDLDGEPYDVYSSARVAAKSLCLSYQGVLDDANGKLVKPCGGKYRVKWLDEYEYED